jgi:aldose 1-epimerase
MQITFTPVSEDLIPTARSKPSQEHRWTFAKAKPSVELECRGGYDHNFVLNDWDGSLRLRPTLRTVTGRVLEILTTEPGMQFYSGNFLDGSLIGRTALRTRSTRALCLSRSTSRTLRIIELSVDRASPGEEYRQRASIGFYR